MRKRPNSRNGARPPALNPDHPLQCPSTPSHPLSIVWSFRTNAERNYQRRIPPPICPPARYLIARQCLLRLLIRSTRMRWPPPLIRSIRRKFRPLPLRWVQGVNGARDPETVYVFSAAKVRYSPLTRGPPNTSNVFFISERSRSACSGIRRYKTLSINQGLARVSYKMERTTDN